MSRRELVVLFRGVPKKSPEFLDALKGVVRRPFDETTRKVLQETALRSRNEKREDDKENNEQDALSMIDMALWHNNRKYYDKPKASEMIFLSSWSRSIDTALLFAKEDGVVLRAALGPPTNPLVWSPDEYNEQEVLVMGDVSNATIMLSTDLRPSPSLPFS